MSEPKSEALRGFLQLFIKANQLTNSTLAPLQRNRAENADAFRGFLPLAEHIKGEFELEGEAPFWILDEGAVAALEAAGALELHGDWRRHSPLPGRLYISCHYLDDRRRERLLRLLGTPYGRDRQWVLSSPRTVAIQHGETAFCLKFCGQTIEKLEARADRFLSRQKVAATVQTNRLLPEQLALREDAGFTLKLSDDSQEDLSVIFREIPLNRVELGRDLYLPVFTCFAPGSPAMKEKIFGVYSEHPEKWLTEQFIPRLADLIWSAFAETGVHLELHQQNLNALLREGHLLALLYQDSCDVLEDPLYQLLHLRLPAEKVGRRRQTEFPACGEYGKKASPFNSFPAFWYRYFLRDFGLFPRTIAQNLFGAPDAGPDFLAELRSECLGRMRNYLAQKNLAPFAAGLREEQVLFGGGADLFAMLNAFRDLVLKAEFRRLGSAVQSGQEPAKKIFQDKETESILLYTYGADPGKIRAGFEDPRVRSGWIHLPDYGVYLIGQEWTDDPARLDLVALFPGQGCPEY